MAKNCKGTLTIGNRVFETAITIEDDGRYLSTKQIVAKVYEEHKHEIDKVLNSLEDNKDAYNLTTLDDLRGQYFGKSGAGKVHDKLLLTILKKMPIEIIDTSGGRIQMEGVPLNGIRVVGNRVLVFADAT